MKKILLLICSVFSLYVNAQNTGITNLWYMGYQSSAGLPYGGITTDFYTGTPIITYSPRKLDLSSCFADIADSNGNMLFYTNGYDIADGTDSIMLNGDSISPSGIRNSYPLGFYVPQSCLIIPNPANSYKYILFHNILENPPSYYCGLHLYYSEIDMTLNGGLGAVINKNTVLISDSLNPGKITACKHANGRDWWVFCMKIDTDVIYKFLITPTGISGPYAQHIGVSRTRSYGQVKFNKAGTKFAYFNANYTTTAHLELIDFDRCSGNFSNPIFFPLSQSTGFGGGIEFSPNDSILYVTNIDSAYQFQVYAPNIATSQTLVASWDSFYSPNPPLSTRFMYSLLAPDGKIYITTGNSTFHMHVINYPDSLGTACDLQQHSVQLPAYYFNTLPNHPNYFLGCDTTSICQCLNTGITEYGVEVNARAAPNPNNGVFTLQFPVQKISGELEVYDVMGNIVRKEYVAPWSQYKHINITQLPGGIYFCKLNWKDNFGSVKIIKE